MAVEASFGVGDSFCPSVGQGVSIIPEVGAVLQGVWVELGGRILHKGIVTMAVEASMRVGDSCGSSVLESHPFVEIGAVLKSLSIEPREVWLLLHKRPVGMAVVSSVWESDSCCPSVLQCHPLVEVRAMLNAFSVERRDCGWCFLHKSPVGVAIVSSFRICDSSGKTVLQCHSLVKVRAMLQSLSIERGECSGCCLHKGIVGMTVVSSMGVRDSCGSAVLKSHPLVEIGAVLKFLSVESWEERLLV